MPIKARSSPGRGGRGGAWQGHPCCGKASAGCEAGGGSRRFPGRQRPSGDTQHLLQRQGMGLAGGLPSGGGRDAGVRQVPKVFVLEGRSGAGVQSL